MPDLPRDYDPSGRSGRSRLPQVNFSPLVPSPDPTQPYVVVERPVFGRRITPPTPAPLEPICPHECRMIDFGGCGKKCRLMAHTDKEEPKWPIPSRS